MFEGDGATRPHYAALLENLTSLPADELRRRKHSADLSFLNQGITFTVYGREEGTERIFPYDLLPRIITSAEWARIEKGLTQRITALNLFLRDIYHEGRILNDGIVPREIVYSCKHFRRQMRGLQVPRNVYVTVVGTDLIRLPNGEFVVLEDNLRVPSGVSYMLTNRQVMKRIFPQLFRSAACARSSTTARRCSRTLRSLAPEGRPEPTIVLLTPGVYNSAYFEHAYPRPADGHRAGRRPRPGHPRQYRLHADHRRPAARRRDLPPRRRRLHRSAGLPRDSIAWRPGPVQRLSRRQRARWPTPSAPASPTTRRSTRTCRRSSSTTSSEDPILNNVETYLLTDPAQRQHVLENLDKLVVKAVGESGGYGMLIGPHSTAKQREEFRDAASRPIRATTSPSRPSDFLARPVP